IRRGGGGGARTQRAGHDQARRNLLPGDRAPGHRAGRGARCGCAGRAGRARADGAAAVTWAVVPAAGSGSRFSAESRRGDPQAVARPKQYLEIDGEPLIAHTLRALLSHPAVAGVVVAPAEGGPHWAGWGAFGGKAARARPKQYLEIDGEPLIAHTLRALLSHPAVAGVVVALAEGDPHWPGWDTFEGKPVRACLGGGSRADSVLAGLRSLPDSVRADDFVLVHDAARPNLSHADLSAL